MSYPAYPEYKDSSVEWLGEVPAHWGLQKIAWHVPYSVGWTPSSGKEEYYDGDNLWVTIADLNKPVIFDTKSKISNKAVDDRGGRLSPAGSMLFSFKLTVGNVSFLGLPAYTNEAIASFEPNENLDLKYWSYAAPQFIPKYGRENIYGALLLNQELIGAVRFYVPDIEEQVQLAAFLDHETARIDALVEEQQRLIELLKEKRQAVISHAVTKGLDPDVLMKDSGVEWLGEVPEHWEVVALRRVLKRVEQGWSPNASNVPAKPAEWGVVKLSAIKKGGFIEKENKALLPDTNPDLGLEIKDGDLLVTRANTPELVGDACIVKSLSESRLMLSDLVYRLRVTIRADALFICWFLISNSGRSQITADARGSSMTMAKISQSHIKSWLLAVPPISEQNAIANYVERELCRIDQLIRECVDTLQLLGERRSALISAAITGKIDVRGWQPPPDSAVATGESTQMESV